MKTCFFKSWVACLAAVFSQTLSLSSQTIPDIDPMLDACNVSWSAPGGTSAGSLPIGNGDIGLNVWVESNGSLDFYIGKTDAWNEDPTGSSGLLKLGAVRISMNPQLAVTPFVQILRLRSGEIDI